jgi:hypothetical protein
MQPRHSIVATLIVACALAGTSAAALAQASAPQALPVLPGPGASAPASAPTGPRQRGPAETGNRATAPGDLQPERPIAPQITIPFGKKPPAAVPKRDAPALPRNSGAPAGGIEDAAARCQSQVDPQELAACRAKLAREARAKLPN